MSSLPHRCRIALGGAGGARPPLLLDLTEVLRAEKKNSRASRPLIAGSGRPFPPYLKVWISHCKMITDPLFAPFFFAFFSSVFLHAVQNKDQEKKTPKAFSIFSPTEDYLLIILSLKRGCKKQAGGCALLCTSVVVLIFLTPSSVPREEGRVVDSYLGIVESLRV